MTQSNQLTNQLNMLKRELERRDDEQLNRFAKGKWGSDRGNWNNRSYWEDVRRKKYIVK